MNGRQFVILSDDFVRALSNEENAFFLPKNEQDIESLYDETSVFSLSYFKKENLLRAYTK